ncbi:MAG: patatin-like phospholipase family protein [Candidatus Aenigmarchaeota archaeon]|nr:patatin-like phospholipase family protein [Candidatus Aenigmarchaeota archaeon]
MKIGLALSGGGTKGLAHIGVIKVLEKNNIPIDFIAGTSAGAIIGGIYASGTPIKELERKILSLKSRDFLGFILDFSKPQGGIVKAERLMNFVKENIKERYIENFKIGFAAVSADISNLKEVVIDKGDVLIAIRASIAYPGLVKPVKIKNSVLVDGGIVNNFPMDVLARKNMDFIIGVKFNSVRKMKDLSYKNVVWRSIKMMEIFLTDFRNKDIKNCIILEPNIYGVSTFSVSDKLAKKAIRAGEKEAKRKLPLIKEKIQELENKPDLNLNISNNL